MNTCDEFNYFDELNITSIKIIRERKIEYKKEIDRVENKIIKKIDDNLNKIINQVNLKRENYVNIIQEIFKNNIEESEKILIIMIK